MPDPSPSTLSFRDVKREPGLRLRRVCVLGLGGAGGFQYEAKQVLEQVRERLELIVVLPHESASCPDLSPHHVTSQHVVRSPALWGDPARERIRLGIVNLVRATRILRRERPQLILGVIAAQTLPFALAARLLGIPLWFVESLTRVRSPSRAGIWLTRLGLCGRLFYHWPELAQSYPRGECTGSSDALASEAPASGPVAEPAGGETILVTVGTHHFDDLVRTVDEAAGAGSFNLTVTAQIGHGTYEPRHCTFFRLAPGLDDYYAAARLVVAHGGTGTTLELLSRGARFISVANPMMQDNHQSEFLEALAAKGLIRYCRDLTKLPAMMTEVLQQPPSRPVSLARKFGFIAHAIDQWGAT